MLISFVLLQSLVATIFSLCKQIVLFMFSTLYAYLRLLVTIHLYLSVINAMV